jgi:TIR domain-containing protein
LEQEMTSVFLSYAHGADSDAAERLFIVLSAIQGIEPWMDKHSLPPGMQWRPAIRKAIREAEYFVALISRRSSVGRGVRHSELDQALEILAEWPPDHIYLIPARLDDCQMPRDDLSELTWIDLFPDWDSGVKKLCATLTSNLQHASKKQESAAEHSSDFHYHYRIGLVDLDIGLSNLKGLAQSLNARQGFFHFTCPELPSVDAAVKTIMGLKNLAVFAIPSSFFAEHPYLAVDLVACFTRYPLAFVEEGLTLSNHFSGPSDVDERFRFMSSDRLYEFTKTAGCSFEQGLVRILLGQLVGFFTNIGYHHETRGCPMDKCMLRVDQVRSLEAAQFCPECEEQLKPGDFRSACHALLSWDPRA